MQQLIWGEPLPWGEEEPRFDLVLGSDLCYDSDLFPLLMATIRQLTDHSQDTQARLGPGPCRPLPPADRFPNSDRKPLIGTDLRT